MIRYGASIEYGADNWQVFQHKQRKADITFGGTWLLPEDKAPDFERGFVYSRVMSEVTNGTVTKWMQQDVNKDGTWELTLKDVPAGGPYRIEANMAVFYKDGHREDIRADSVFHICVGEVFIIAGQSNSAGCARDSAYDPPEMGVSLFRNCEKWDLASHPLEDDSKYEHSANIEHNIFSSPWLMAAKEYKRITGLPVGLVQTSLGGSGLGHWNPEWDGENAGYLYKNMLEIVKKCGTKPEWVLWYQGCSDTGPGASDIYLEKFGDVVRQWRRDLDDPDLKFLTVQLNRYCAETTEEADAGWGKVRDAQRRAAKTIPGVYVIPATDVGLSDGIHNNATGNTKIGIRSGRMCAEVDLGIHVTKAPDISKAYIKGDELFAEFDDLESHIFIIDTRKSENAFTLTDEKGVVETEAAVCWGRGIKMKLLRETYGECRLAGLWQMAPKAFPPVDFESYMPFLSFYNVKVEKQ